MTQRAARFLVVGALAFVLDTSATLLLASAMSYLVANSIGFALANLLNFALGHFWVFGGAADGTAIRHAFPRVMTVSIVGLGITDSAMFVLVDGMGLQLLPAKVAATAAVMVWNFLARHCWIYRVPEQRSA